MFVMFNVNDHVRWSGDNQVYIVIAVHKNTNPTTYDIQSTSGSTEVVHYNVPEGDLHIAD
jgi:hypothetical protein